MKVALMAFAGVNRCTSLGRLTYLTYEGLESLGHEVYLITKDELRPEFKYIKLESYPKIFGKDILTDVISNYFAVKKLNPDVYHYIYNHTSALPALVFPGRYKKVVTVHDLKPLVLRQLLNRIEKINMFMLKYSIRIIDKIIVPSRSVKDEMLELFNIEDDKVSVVYNPVDPAFRKLNEEEYSDIKMKYGNFILNVSRFNLEKNPYNLLRAFRIISKCIDNIRLVIVGAFWIKATEIIRKELGEYAENVIVIDHIDNEDLVKMYNASQALLFPSLYEGFGMPIIEAMASGTPVITSNRGAMKELAEGYAILVDPEDPEDIAEKTCMLLSSPALQNELRLKGLERAKEFHYLKIARELEKVYNEIR